jgi:hypothetical protein
MSYLPIKDIVHPSQKSDKLEKLTQYCKQNGVLFVDKEFPPEKASLCLSPPHPDYRGQFDRISWKRAAELFGEGAYDIFRGITPCDIRQGALGDCYFLCALSSLAEQPELIRRLFDVTTVNEFGICSVWLNINGGWKSYILDEYFPSVQTRNGFDLAFSKTDQKELWVILLEKAYAKAYGSYWDIIGGDPVHALRDLTGAPYDRIEDYSDLNVAWEKLKLHNAQNFIITCFTKSTEVTEEKSGEGLVSGHAYSILDVREVMDSRGKLARLVQIRNPWGKFEWTGNFSDNSPLWTPQAKAELKIETKDDGVFWMPFEDFVQYFEGIGTVKTHPGYVGNSVFVKRADDQSLTTIRLTIRQQTNLTLSIDQIDSRIIDSKDYAYSYFRVTVGRLKGKDTIEFVDAVLSPERNIFLENIFPPGDYIVLVEPYWSGNLAESFTVGTYSDAHVELELIKTDATLYRKTEYTIWKQFAAANKTKMEMTSSRVASDAGNEAKIDTYKLQNKKYANILYSFFNNSPKATVHSTFTLVNVKGFTPNARTVSGNTADVLVNPTDNDILLFNMDPRASGFSLSYKVSAEEVIPYKFSPDTNTLEMLNALGGSQPTLENDDSKNITSRLQKQKEIEERERKNKEIEAERKRQQEIAIQRAKDKRRRQEEEHNKLMELLKQTQEMLGLKDQNFFGFNANANGGGFDPFSMANNAFFNGNGPNTNGGSNQNGGGNQQGGSNAYQYRPIVHPNPVPYNDAYFFYGDPKPAPKKKDDGCRIF